jgi:hypothetical protein
LIGFQFDRRLADGAHQDLQQFFADRHSRNIQFSSFPYVLNYAFTLTECCSLENSSHTSPDNS